MSKSSIVRSYRSAGWFLTAAVFLLSLGYEGFARWQRAALRCPPMDAGTLRPQPEWQLVAAAIEKELAVNQQELAATLATFLKRIDSHSSQSTDELIATVNGQRLNEGVMIAMPLHSGAESLATIATVIALLPHQSLLRSVRFVFFTRQVPAKEKALAGFDAVAGTILFGSLHHFNTSAGSQSYLPIGSLLYPNSGDFLAFVSDERSRGIADITASLFQRYSTMDAQCFKSAGPLTPRINMPSASLGSWDLPYVFISDTGHFRKPGEPAPVNGDRRRHELILGLMKTIVGLANDPDPARPISLPSGPLASDRTLVPPGS